MWCFPCLKPSTKDDQPEDHFGPGSWHEERRSEAEQLDWAMRESLKQQRNPLPRQQEEDEERRRISAVEDDAQLARALQNEESERQIDNKSALEYDEEQQVAKAVEESLKIEEKRKQSEEEQVKKDEQLARKVQDSLNMETPLDEDQQVAKAVKESLKEEEKRKQSEEQVKKDEQLARKLQDSLNVVESPPLLAEKNGVPLRSPLDEDEQQLSKAIEESLKERGKGKKIQDEQVNKDEQFAVVLQERLNTVESPPRLAENENISTTTPLDEEDEQLATALKESLKDKGKGKQPKDEGEEDEKTPVVNPAPSMCGGCNIEIEHGKFVDVLGVLWHPDCLWCDACHKQFTIPGIENIVSNSRGNFHKHCYGRYCYVCKAKVRIREFNQHPFWKENYCPAHESDKTPKCCSCERLEPKGANYVILGDKRQLCLECMESAVMDTDEVQPLHFEIREYFEGLNMKIEKEFPLLLVEKQALNKAEEEEGIKDNQYELVTRGICLSEAQTIRVVAERLKMEPNRQLVDIRTEPQEVVRTCEVTAILILYGFPRVMTGYILAHEMMHAYLRLNGHKIVNNVMEEGICQVLGHMWLESQIYAPVEAEASSSASVSSHIPVAAACASKKGKCSDFERKLVEFCKNQIETDDSPIYGVGFKRVNRMVVSDDYNLKETLKKIIIIPRKS